MSNYELTTTGRRLHRWVRIDPTPPPPPDLTVILRDERRDGVYQWGWHDAPLRTVTIAGVCPVCGGRRGTPHLTGETHTWTNPCGHSDRPDAVLREETTR